MTANPSYKALIFGPLPVAIINEALGTELEEGEVRLSKTAHKHIAVDHPDDYLTCINHLASVIAAPTFIGQAPKHSKNIELIKRVGLASGDAVLVAIGLEPDALGAYRVVSSYLLPTKEVDSKRQKGYLKQVLIK